MTISFPASWTKAQDAFVADVANGLFAIDWGEYDDLLRAKSVWPDYPSLRIGFVDAPVIATAERLKAEAIATLDLRHFAVVSIEGRPRAATRDR